MRRDDQRELLFELDTARRAIFQRDGEDEVFDLVSRSYTNLLRQWGECPAHPGVMLKHQSRSPLCHVPGPTQGLSGTGAGRW